MGGGTLAYLTDTETADNTFTVGKVKIDLEEPNYPGNDSDEVKAIVPNQTVAKDPQIENTGNNEAIVYLKVEVPQEEYTELGTDNVPGEKKLQDLFALKDVSDQWELIRTETTTTEDGKTKTSYIYAYKKPLGKGETTDKLFQKVQMKNSMESDLAGKVEDIIVTAYAIQSTDVSDISLTPADDGTLGKDILDQVYTVFLNQSGQETPRPADEGDRSQTGKLGKITYDLDGGSLEGALTEYGTGDYGYTPPTPTKKGYIFTGWTPEALPIDSTESVNFTATWKEENAATLETGKVLNSRMKTLANGRYHTYDSYDSIIASIQRSDIEPTDSVKNDLYSLASTKDSTNPVYMWYEDGAIKWWSAADTVYANQDSSYLCASMSALTDISGLKDWKFDDTANMKSVFCRCEQLVDLAPLANWNINNVTDISEAFYYCHNLTNLSPLTNWDTANVEDMNGVFFQCEQLTDLTPLANWNTGNVTNISAILAYCYQLTDLTPLANWSTNKVTDMSSMITGCNQITDLTALVNWHTDKVTDMRGMFARCTNLVDITPLAKWNTSHVTDMSNMFGGDPTSSPNKLADITPLTNWNTNNVTNMSWMFYNCNQLSDLTPLTHWHTNNVTDMSYMFDTCSQIADITALINWNTSKVTNMSYMFDGCYQITDFTPLMHWDTANVTDMSWMFYSCSGLTDLTPLANWNTGNVMDMSYMFYGFDGFTDLIPLANWNTGNVTNMACMFAQCNKITDLTPLANWDVANVTSMAGMFEECYALTNITALSNWDTGNVTAMNAMFQSCKKLTDASALNDWDIMKVRDFARMFSGCPSHPEFTKRAGTWPSNSGAFTGTFKPTT